MIGKKITTLCLLLLLLSLFLTGCGEKEQPTQDTVNNEPTEAGTEVSGPSPQGSYTLPPEQLENYSSATCHLMKRESQTDYRVQYSNCPVILSDGILTPDFSGMAIELSGPGDESFYPSFDLGMTQEGERSYIGSLCLTENTEDLPFSLWRYMLLVQEETATVRLVAMGPDEGDIDEKLKAGQHRDLPDPDIYIDAFFADGVFYTPAYDEAGQILPIGQWETESIIYGHTYPWPRQIHASYTPLKGGDYYWIYKITWKDGTVSYSDLLPYSTPEKEPEAPMPTVCTTWAKGERQQLVLEQNGVQIYLAVAKDASGSSYYTIKARNDRDSTILCQAEDLRLNGTVDCSGTLNLRVQPGKFVSDEAGFFIGVPDGSQELETIQSLQFSLQVEDDMNGAPLVEKQTVLVDMTEAWRIPKKFEDVYHLTLPSMDLLAGEQVLLETSTLRVTLLCAGGKENDAFDRLTLTLKAENLSPHSQTLQIPGYVLNGVFVPTYDNVSIGGNCVTYLTSYLSASTVKQYTVTSVETLTAVIAAQGTEDWFFPSVEYHRIPIVTDMAGQSEPFVFGDLLWEHEGIRIGLRGYNEDKGKWELTLSNQWEQPVNIHVMEEGSPRYITNEIYAGVGEYTFFTVASPYGSSDAEVKSREIYFRIYDFGGETLLYEGSEHITLQSK